MKVAIIVPAFEPVPGLPTATAPRKFHAADSLAKSLGEALGIDVPVVEGSLKDVSMSGYLLVFELPRDFDRQLGPRIVAFFEDRSTIMKSVEERNLAGAVEKHRYFLWRTRRGDERGYGLVGRKDVAQQMGARLLSGPYTSTRYAALAHEGAGDLIELLASYLRAYEQFTSEAE